jgi:hypothetical protein
MKICSVWDEEIFAVRAKAKAVSLHTMEALAERGGIAPTQSRPWH